MLTDKTEWFDDFETEPIGGGNPYHRCSGCKRSVPEINYSLEGHYRDCPFQIAEEDRRYRAALDKRSRL